MCAELHVLPDPGGLLQQDPYWVDMLGVFYEVKEAIQAEEEKKAGNVRPV
jgi:hypothetical protein